MKQAGISDAALQQAAILDYLVTGSIDFINGTENLQQLGGVASSSASASVYLSDPPSTPAVYGVTAAATKVVEASTGETDITFDVYRTGSASATAIIDYAVVDPNDEYLGAWFFGATLPSGQVTLATGVTSQAFVVKLPGGIGVRPDGEVEVAISSADDDLISASLASTTVINSQPIAGPPAVAEVSEISGGGKLIQNASGWTLQLNLAQASTSSPIELAVENAATAPADLLSGTITATSSAGFTTGLSDAFANLAAGQINDFLTLAPVTTTPGIYSITVKLSSYDVNDSSYSEALPTQTLTVTETVYGFAAGSVSTTTVSLGNVRAGQTPSYGLSIGNSASTPAEDLDVSVLSTGGGVTATGSIARLAAGKTDSNDIAVGVATTAAGDLDGSVTLGFQSDGANLDGNGTTTLLPQTVQVTAVAYREAVGQVAPFEAIVHVGDPGQQSLVISNVDPADGYSEGLLASLVSASGAISVRGGPSGLVAAGESDSETLTAAYSTATAGTITGNVTIDYQTDGEGTSGLGTLQLGDSVGPISITIDNYADAAIKKTSGGGALSQSDDTYTLDLGNIVQGGAPVTVDFGIYNVATGQADALSGSFKTNGPAVFTLGGFNAFSGLAAGQSDGDLTVTLAASSAGTFTETITLLSVGSNASGYSGALAPETLIIEGTVVGSTSTLTVAQYLADIAGADAIPGGFYIQDSAASVEKAIDALNSDPHLVAIELTDTGTPTLVLTASQFVSDTIALSKIEGEYEISVGGVVAERKVVAAGMFHGESYASYILDYTSTGFHGLTRYYDASGALLVSESFTSDGGDVIQVGGKTIERKVVAAGIFHGESYASYILDYTSTGFHDLTRYYDASGNLLASETFTPDGGDVITVGGKTVERKVVATGTFRGESYASLILDYSSTGFHDLTRYYDASGDLLASESFTTDGGDLIQVGGKTVERKVVATGTFRGESYASLIFDYASTGFHDLTRYYDASGTLLASESFTSDGGDVIQVGGKTVERKVVAAADLPGRELRLLDPRL